jgi:hypothetical protein
MAEAVGFTAADLVDFTVAGFTAVDLADSTAPS